MLSPLSWLHPALALSVVPAKASRIGAFDASWYGLPLRLTSVETNARPSKPVVGLWSAGSLESPSPAPVLGVSLAHPARVINGSATSAATVRLMFLMLVRQ